MRVQPGRIANEAAMVRALKTRGEYRSGVPRSRADEPPKQEPKKPASFRPLTRREMQFVNFNDPEYQAYINDRVNAEKE